MLTIKCGLLNQHVIKLYDDTNELTAIRWKEIQKYAFETAEIGSDMHSFHNNMAKLFKFVGANKRDETLQEIQNINRNVFYAISGISIKSFEFALFVHSINGKTCYDLSQGGLESTINKLESTGLKQSQVETILDDLKKIVTQLKVKFPKRYNGAIEDNILDYMERKANYQLDYILEGKESLLQLIEDADDYLLAQMAPKDYDENNTMSAINQMDKAFENLCSSLEEMGVSKPKELTVFEFESKIEYFKRKKTENK